MSLIAYQSEQEILKRKNKPYWKTIESNGVFVKYERVQPKKSTKSLNSVTHLPFNLYSTI